jgi:hypothetical protein
LRAAFNTPFWPHMLASTSVGQEGLDFHTWCARVAHWDLCPGPVELEQREGRVNRYAGLAVRRSLAAQLREHALAGGQEKHNSPWARMEMLANASRDTSGMQPWWQMDEAPVRRYLFTLRMGKDNQRFELLQEQRLLYRLALGQPNPEDLVRGLAVQDPATLEILRSLALNLCPFENEAALDPTSVKRRGPPEPPPDLDATAA